MRRDATVISVDLQRSANEVEQLTACVEIEPMSQCLRCDRGEGCGAANLALLSTYKGTHSLTRLGACKPTKLQLFVNIEQGASVKVGQQLVIDIDDEQSGSTWLWAVFGAYGLPLAGMMIATGVASALWGTGGADPASSLAELRILMSAGAGLFSGLVVWRLTSHRLLQISERSLCLLSARIVQRASELPN